MVATHSALALGRLLCMHSAILRGTHLTESEVPTSQRAVAQ